MSPKIILQVLKNNKKNRLKFPVLLEEKFLEDYFDKTIFNTRVAILLGCSLYAIFGILDFFIVPNVRKEVWIVRYGVECPSFLIVFFLSYIKKIKKYYQYFLFLISIVAGWGIFYMIILSSKKGTGYEYYVGIMLVITWGCTFIRMRFYYAFFSTLVLIISYYYVAVEHQNILKSNVISFLNNNFFILGLSAITLLTNFFMEKYTRTDFLQRYLIKEDKNEIEKQNKKIKQELLMAKKIQTTFLPSYPEQNIHFLYRPATFLGGDFFDFIRFQDNDKIGIILCDVVGHGVPAALITSMIKTVILQDSKHKNDPAEMLRYFNDVLFDKMDGNYFTAFYCIYDKRGKVLKYSNAGHVKPFLLTKNKVTELNEENDTGTFIGVFSTEEMERHKCGYRTIVKNIYEGTKIFLYTDGLIESTNGLNQIFDKKIIEYLEKYRLENSENIIKKIYKQLLNFKNKDTFDDDITILCLEM